MNYSSHPPLLTDGAFFIDNSTFESIMTCDRESEYEILHKRVGGGRNASLHFGGAVHSGLAVRYKNPKEFAPKLLNAMYDEAMKEVGNRPLVDGDWRTAELLYEVLQRYCLTHPAEEFEVLFRQTPVGPVACTEIPFAQPLGTITLHEPLTLVSKNTLTGECKADVYKEIPVVWTGRIDVLIRAEGSIWTVDHKTTSIYGGTYFDQYYLSNQMTGYVWAAREALSANSAQQVYVAGVMINVLAIRKPTRTGKGIEFGRQYISVPHHRIEEWKRHTLGLVSRFFTNMIEGFFPMKTMWCITKFSRKCQYFDVCTVNEADRLTMLYSNMYQAKTWSPLD